MHRFIDGEERTQRTLLPNRLEDYVSEENPVRVIEVFIDELDLAALGFAGMTPAATGRPAYHPWEGEGVGEVGKHLDLAYKRRLISRNRRSASSKSKRAACALVDTNALRAQ